MVELNSQLCVASGVCSVFCVLYKCIDPENVTLKSLPLCVNPITIVAHYLLLSELSVWWLAHQGTLILSDKIQSSVVRSGLLRLWVSSPALIHSLCCLSEIYCIYRLFVGLVCVSVLMGVLGGFRSSRWKESWYSQGFLSSHYPNTRNHFNSPMSRIWYFIRKASLNYVVSWLLVYRSWLYH